MTPIDNSPEFMASFYKGEDSAFRSVYESLSRSLLHFADSIINHEEDASDIVANCFMKLYINRAERESQDHIRRWMFVIVRNECIDYMRAKVRKRELVAELQSLADDVDHSMLRSLLLDTMRGEVAKLPAQRRHTLYLYYFKGKTTFQIAEILGTRPQTPLNNKTRAIDSLRKSLRMVLNAAELELGV